MWRLAVWIVVVLCVLAAAFSVRGAGAATTDPTPSKAPAPAPTGTGTAKATAALDLTDGYDYNQVLYATMISPSIAPPKDSFPAMDLADVYGIVSRAPFQNPKLLKFTKGLKATSLGNAAGYAISGGVTVSGRTATYQVDRVDALQPSLEKQAEDARIGFISQAVVSDFREAGNWAEYRLTLQVMVMGKKGWRPLLPKPTSFAGTYVRSNPEGQFKALGGPDYILAEALVFTGMLPVKVVDKKAGETGLRLTLSVQNKFAYPVKNLVVIAAPAKGARLAVKADIEVEIQPGATETASVSLNIDNLANYTLWVQPRDRQKPPPAPVPPKNLVGG